MTSLPHLAQLLLNRPLAITPEKASVILAALVGRLGISQLRLPDGRMRAFDRAGETVMTGGDDLPADDDGEGYEVIAGIAVIPVYGTLVQRQLGLRPVSGMTGFNAIRANFSTALADPEVRGIAFDINSPGGDVAGCFDLTDEIYSARGSKAVWAILDESACSAAYAIAAACDKVTVPRTGYAGSIGVIVLHVDISRMLANEGVTVTVIQYGARKADGQPAIPLSDPARARLQGEVDTVGRLFVSSVARYRGISTERVRATEAAVYLGAAGREPGLVDTVMSPAEAFAALVKVTAAHQPPAASGSVRVPSREEIQHRGIASPNMRRLRRLGIFPPMAS